MGSAPPLADPEVMAVFPRMAEILPQGEWGGARVYHTTFDEQTARSASYVGGRYVSTPPGTYAALLVKTDSGHSECMMGDLGYERATCLEVVRRAHGNVLIAGLGLGMILHPILDKSDVSRVTVVEKYQDVVDLDPPHAARDRAPRDHHRRHLRVEAAARQPLRRDLVRHLARHRPNAPAGDGTAASPLRGLLEPGEPPPLDGVLAPAGDPAPRRHFSRRATPLWRSRGR